MNESPLKSRVRTLFLVPTFHYDVAYLKTHADYMPECLRILDTALDLLARHPEYRFMIEQVILLEAYWERRPERRDALVRFAREGRLTSAPGMYVMPDMNHCDGESLYQQVRLGKEWLEKNLGLKPDVCWIADCWGHHAQLPQILSQCGYRYYAFWRCMRRDVMRTRFLWKGLDGTSLRAHWLARGYGNILFPAEAAIQNAADQDLAGSGATSIGKVCADLLAVEALPTLMLCNGGDFLQPQASAPEAVRRLNAAGELPPLRFATPVDFLDSLDWSAAPSFDGEFNSALQGTFTSHIRLKQRNRELVRALLSLETLLVLAGRNAPSLDAIWKILLKQQFHDIICGTITDAAVTDSLKEFDEASRAIDDAAASILGLKGDPAVFNTTTVERTDRVLRDGRICRITIPPLGATPLDQAVPLPDPVPVSLPLSFATPWYRARLNAEGYLYSLVESRSGIELIRPDPAPFGSLGLQLDYGDLWLNFEAPLSGGSLASILTQNNPDPYDRSAPGEITNRATMKPRVLSVRAVTVGADEIEVEQKGILTFWRLVVRYTTRMRLSVHHPRIEYETRLEPAGKHYRLRAAFPTSQRDGRILHEIPFGIQERGPAEHVAQTWAACLGPRAGVALLNQGTPGNTIDDGILMLTLFRSAAMEYKAHSELGFLDGIPHTFRYAILPVPAGAETEIVRQGVIFNTPCLTGFRPKKHEKAGEWRLAGDDNVILSSLRWSGRMVLVRVYECAGRPGSAVLHLPARFCKAAPANGLQQPAGDFTSCNGSLTLELKPFEIRQFVLA
jgi:alpha-mannosidase